MRIIILTVGLLLVLIGAFVVNQGAQFLTPLAESFGLASVDHTSTAVIAPTLLSIAPSNYTFLMADLSAGAQVNGMLTVADGKEVALYVMDESNFSQWRIGRPSKVALARPFLISYNFTFTPSVGGAYFFIFDNQDTTRRAVIFSLSSVQSHIVLNPIAEYAGYEIFAIGFLLTLIGVKAGNKRKSTEQEEAYAMTGWKCKFCGAENSNDQVFCSKCERSKH